METTDLTLRPARPADRDRIVEITGDVWGGRDYIPKVFDRWVSDAGAAFQAAEIEGVVGKSICDNLLDNHIDIEHACEKQAACTTCHVVLRQGFDSLEPAEEKEEDMLDKAWGLEATSRLSCQAKVADEDLVVELPKYTINYEREGGGKKP